tara:strand:+ start:13786 stop:14115 length:330 start_codon:yes stop_codon:yes gene_type:complete
MITTAGLVQPFSTTFADMRPISTDKPSLAYTVVAGSTGNSRSLSIDFQPPLQQSIAVFASITGWYILKLSNSTRGAVLVVPNIGLEEARVTRHTVYAILFKARLTVTVS